VWQGPSYVAPTATARLSFVEVSLPGIVLLVAALVLLLATEWPRIAGKTGLSVPRRRPRRRKSHLHVVEPYDESDEFARSVERDLARLPTIDESDRKR
jgi:hypothetical protein